jgi:hypothetical protein
MDNAIKGGKYGPRHVWMQKYIYIIQIARDDELYAEKHVP